MRFVRYAILTSLFKFSSSGNTSHSSVTRSLGKSHTGYAVGPKVAFVNERKPIRDAPKSSTARPRNPHKGSWMLLHIALFVLVLFRIYL